MSSSDRSLPYSWSTISVASSKRLVRSRIVVGRWVGPFVLRGAIPGRMMLQAVARAIWRVDARVSACHVAHDGGEGVVGVAAMPLEDSFCQLLGGQPGGQRGG